MIQISSLKIFVSKIYIKKHVGRLIFLQIIQIITSLSSIFVSLTFQSLKIINLGCRIELYRL